MTEDNGNKKVKDGCFSIFVSHKKSDNTWGEPEALSDVINTSCERDPKIMADNRTLIFSSIKPDGKGKYDLYQSRLMPDGEWTDPVALDFVNSEENDQSPCISASGNKMFFFSDNDIYEIVIPPSYRQLINITVLGTILSEKTNKPLRGVVTARNTKTGQVFSLPNNANDGRYTLVLAAGQAYELVFKSEGYLQESFLLDYTKQENYLEERKDVQLKSDFKLTVSTIDKDLKKSITSFVKITEPGVGVVFQDSIYNGVVKTFDLQTTADYEISALANRYPEVKKKFKYNLPIYKDQESILELVHEKVRAVTEVTDIRTNQKMKMKVTYNNENADEVIIADGGESVLLRKGDRYQVVTNSEEGYAYAIANIIADDSNGPINITLRVTQIIEGAKLSLEHIYFASNASDLNETSTAELASIVHLLKQYPDMMIEISAHTDNVGSDDYNITLSQKRATSVTAYLEKHGVPMKRLMAKGYGKTQPIAPNDTDENRARNRRVELLVLKIK
jgi:outer membrane protein OmpA-like peptidoglycan-associated protein